VVLLSLRWFSLDMTISRLDDSSALKWRGEVARRRKIKLGGRYSTQLTASRGNWRNARPNARRNETRGFLVGGCSQTRSPSAWAARFVPARNGWLRVFIDYVPLFRGSHVFSE
jgi:hypothetical protein